MENKWALVTGASLGIGADFARQLAKLGCNVVLVARSEARLHELAAELMAAHGVKAEVFAMDLVAPGAAERLFERVAAAGLEIDILINNAGFGLYGDFADENMTKLREMLQLNVFVLTELTRLFLPAMRARRSGRIMQVGSIGSYMNGPRYGVYSASKAYVLSFGEALNLELKGSGVTCTVVCPGMTATNFFEVAGDTEPSLYHRLVMMRSRQVARLGVKAMLAGRSSTVTGVLNKLQVFGAWLMPKRVTFFLADIMLKMR